MTRRGHAFTISIALITSLACGMASPEAASDDPVFPQVPEATDRRPDVIFVPTREPVVDAMLDITGVGPDDIVYDLGSGDGRIVIAAARRGARGVGIDIDPQRIREANENAREAGVTDKVTFVQGDLFEADIREATVVTLYLLPSLNVKLRPMLMEQLRPGTRIASHDFDMGDWEPEKTEHVDGKTVYFWTIPKRQGPQ
jgi:SAM-dependent methyltransferase